MSKSLFWRNPDIPQIELRRVEDGRKVNYAPHSHQQWSIGAITHGVARYQYRQDSYAIAEQDLVMMNPEWVHSCNPVDNQPWAYWMMYVDTDWLTQLSFEAGLLQQPQWQPISRAMIRPQDHSHLWYQDYCRVAEAFIDDNSDLLEKQSLLIDFLLSLMSWLRDVPVSVADSQQPQLQKPEPLPPQALRQVAALLEQNLSETPQLSQLTALANCSEGHLIRSFKQYFGLTPHAYLINRRIQYSQQLLKQGMDIVDVAQQLAFSDQAHFQRTFKRLTATTPGQYLKNG